MPAQTVPQLRQFCCCCLETTDDYATKILEDGRRFHLHRDPQRCTATAERRADYTTWFGLASQ
jgi:hypothetical protein